MSSHTTSSSVPKDPLRLLADYGVVICTKCRFAVQPQAIATHLLRHKIYRSDRAHILKWLSKVSLLEPEEVTPPKPDELPVPNLPVYRGIKCLARGCSHCCTSIKRMNKHWSEQHGEHESKNVIVRSTSVQTFFRGTKTRYFEVDGSRVAHAVPLNLNSNSKASQFLVQPTLLLSNTSGITPMSATAVLDMPSLQYLHSFTVSPHLKPRRCYQESMSFWSETIPQEALKHDFLMHAILGLSALHFAAIAPDLGICGQHCEAAVLYQSAGIEGFHRAVLCPTTANSNALVSFPRFIGLQQIIRIQVEQRLGIETTSKDTSGLHHVTETFFMVRGTVHILLSLQHLLPPRSAFILDDDARDILGQQDYFLNHKHTSNTPLSFSSRITNLSQALADTLTSNVEQQAFDQAARVLLTSACHSWISDELYAAANGIDSWPYLVPENFVRMLEQLHPAALILFSHWCLLLRRFESHYTYIGNHSELLIQIVKKSLSPELSSLLHDLERAEDGDEFLPKRA